MNEEKKKENHVKLIIFVAIIMAILVLNHIFGWSKYIGNINNLKMLDDMVDNNLSVALAIYAGLTIVGCVVLESHLPLQPDFSSDRCSELLYVP